MNAEDAVIADIAAQGIVVDCAVDRVIARTARDAVRIVASREVVVAWLPCTVSMPSVGFGSERNVVSPMVSGKRRSSPS